MKVLPCFPGQSGFTDLGASPSHPHRWLSTLSLPGRGWEDAARAHAAQKAVVGEPRLSQLAGRCENYLV